MILCPLSGVILWAIIVANAPNLSRDTPSAVVSMVEKIDGERLKFRDFFRLFRTWIF